MILWLGFALMTGAAIGAVLWPLKHSRGSRVGSDIEVYRDQLEEIKRDRSTGLIGEAEAEAASVEVSRRLIAAADAAATEKPEADGSQVGRRRWTAVAALALLPAGAVAFYVALGSPEMPGAPLSARAAATAESRSIEALVAQVEAHVEGNPNDGKAWEVLAPVYMRLGRADDAVTAWRNVIRLNGSSASREADFGEAVVAAADGVVTPEAKAAFERALTFDGQDVMARFYMGLAADQDGRRADADAIWRELLASAPPGASWVEAVRHAMARTAPATPTSPSPAPGPNVANVAAAAKLAPDQQDQMIAGMVARLAERLKQNGSDVEGWLRLVRSYRVLEQDDKVQTAIADARRALAAEPDKLADFSKRVEAGDAGAPLVPVAPAMAALPGPSAADVEAAAGMNDKDRNAMIGTMVSRLADRLKQNGNDIDGWQRLLRAYMVLGDRDQAQAAAGNARRALGSDPNKIRQLDDTIKSLGLNG
jgi:cytochrome c-type biogenesis protein CcmH